MALSIEDLGDRRVVKVLGDQMIGQAFCKAVEATHQTELSMPTIQALARITGEGWLISQLKREAHIEERISNLVARYCDSGDRLRVLDYGCGTGASSVCLARHGLQVTGVDVTPDLLEVGRLRAQDHDLTERTEFVDVEDTARLPFGDSTFDAVFACGVFEHISPPERDKYAGECWRVLRPGGVFVITDTPSRFWMLEGHTTGLPLVHWLPMTFAIPLIARFGRIPGRVYTARQLVADGFVGLNLISFLKHLPGARVGRYANNPIRSYFGQLRDNLEASRRHRCVNAWAEFVSWLIYYPVRAAGLPIEAFLPYIELGIEKGSEETQFRR